MADVDREIGGLLAREAQTRAETLRPQLPAFPRMWATASQRAHAHWNRPIWVRPRFLAPLALSVLVFVVGVVRSLDPSPAPPEFAHAGFVPRVPHFVQHSAPPKAEGPAVITRAAVVPEPEDVHEAAELLAAVELMGPTDFLLQDEETWLAESFPMYLE